MKKKLTKKELEEMVREKDREIEKLRKERDEYLDLARRITADFDNFRKRMEKREEDMRKFAGENILRDLLPLVDDLERALNHIPAKGEMKEIRQGIELIYQRFQDFLRSHNVVRMESVGKDFNPQVHEAIAVEGNGEREVVVEELEPGYLIHGKLFRPAKVKVRKIKEGIVDEV